MGFSLRAVFVAILLKMMSPAKQKVIITLYAHNLHGQDWLFYVATSIASMESSIVGSSGKPPLGVSSNTGISSPVSLSSSISTDFIAFKESDFRSPSWAYPSNRDSNLSHDVNHHILQSSNQNRPEDLKSFWQEFGFVFSVSMSQILTVTIRWGVGVYVTNLP